MNDEQRATELRAIVTNKVFQETLDGLEADAFDKFMAMPMSERMDRAGQALIAHIDALRDVRDSLTWLASTTGARKRTSD